MNFNIINSLKTTLTFTLSFVCTFAFAQTQQPNVLVEIAKTAYQNGKYDMAVNTYTEAIAAYESEATTNLYYAYLERGAAYMKILMYKKAIEDFDMAVVFQPNRSDALLCRAQANLALRNYDKVQEDCNAALRLNNKLERAYYLRAQSKLENGKAEDALVDFDRSLRIAPTAGGFNDRGYTKLALGNYQAAIADFDYAIKLDSTFTTAYRNRAKARVRGGELQVALADYDAAIKNSEDAETLTERGLLYIQLKKYNRAINDFDNALQLKPNDKTAADAKKQAENLRSEVMSRRI
jgi:tetratricopeptide (TPR) repeat protein